MTGRTFAPAAVSGCVVAASILAACGGFGPQAGGRATHETDREHFHRVSGRCPATAPKGNGSASDDGFSYGNDELAVALWPNGRLVAGPLPDGARYADIRPDGSVVAKLGWWRGLRGPLTVKGERLDGRAAPLRATVPHSGYGSTGFLPSLLTFPTEGCWKVVGSVGRAKLAFVVRVRKQPLR